MSTTSRKRLSRSRRVDALGVGPRVLDDSRRPRPPVRASGCGDVGGLIFQALGRVPRAGEELTLDGFRIVVERVTRRALSECTSSDRALAGREG